MRYFTFILIGYVVLGLQCGLGPYIRWHGAAPNLVLLAVTFAAINAPKSAALMGCFIIGLLHDMVSLNPLGTYALAYGITALVLTSAAPMLPRDKVSTFAGMTFVALLIVQLVLLISGSFFPPGLATRLESGVELPPVSLPFSVLFFEGLYTLLLSPVLFIPMRRLNRLMNLNVEPRGFGSRV